MEKQKFDCVVIGGGPGGYVAAIRASQKGLKTALIEANELGGTCLNRGCIPSKALIANAHLFKKIQEADRYGISVGEVSFDYALMKKQKDELVNKIRHSLEGLVRSNKITIFNGFGKFHSPHEIKVIGKDEALIEAANTIIATGSEPGEIPTISYDYKVVHDSTSLLNIHELPKKIIIIGGGVIGCEFASLYNTFGVEVTIIELLPSIIPTEGTKVSETLSAIFKKKEIKIETNATVQTVEHLNQGAVVHLSDKRAFDANLILLAVGRKYNSSKIGLEKIGVIIEEDGSIAVNDAMQTSISHIYAIGDVTGKWLLAHVASHQGIIAADNIAGHPCRMNYNAVPSVIFTDPEIATVGYTLGGAVEAGYNATSGKFPFQALGKSQAIIETEGFAQIVIEKETGQILGAQVVGHQASTLIAEMVVAIGNELTIHSISEIIHAHPTLPEAWMEAAFSADGLPLHLPPSVKR